MKKAILTIHASPVIWPKANILRKIIVVVTLTCFVLTMQSCYTRELIQREEVRSGAHYSILKVVLLDETVVEFQYADTGGYGEIVGDQVVGYVKYDDTTLRLERIPLSQVRLLFIRKIDTVNTTLAVIGVSAALAGVAAVIAIATKESCPFVYSFDGEKYIFDGEPYGGAICPALQRTDLCRLEYLQPLDNLYRLRLTNEVDETQYTDQFKLWIVDHPAGVEPIPDNEGQLHTVKSPYPPLTAFDSHGADVLHWLSQKDDLVWEGNLLEKNLDDPSALRDTLFLTFPRPADADEAKLVVNGGTTLWGSQMLKRSLELRGHQIHDWYRALSSPEARARLAEWNLREEVYYLRVHLWADTAWADRGIIMYGGPFLIEDRIVPLDLTGVEGDTVRMMLTPPAGFWQLNYLAVDYSPDSNLTIQEMEPATVVADDGTDLLSVLSATDSLYYAMPNVGQYATLTFVAPPERPGFQRAVFAKVNGYYDIHLDDTRAPDIEEVNRIAREAGYITRFSLHQYSDWRRENAMNEPTR